MSPTPVTMRAIRNGVEANLWALTSHARERAGRRRIFDEELVRAIAIGEVIEDYVEW